MAEKKAITLEDAVKQINELREQIRGMTLAQVKALAPASPDLNNDGVVTPGEQRIFDFFQEVIKDMQKNGFWTSFLVVVFAVAMVFFSLL